MRFRKSVKMGPVRLNFSSKGVGASVGVKGARIGVNSRGTYTSASAFGLSTGPQYLTGGRSRSPGPRQDVRNLAAIGRMQDDTDRAMAYQALVHRLTSVHRDADTDLVEWYTGASEAPGPPPVRGGDHEDAALAALAAYEPGFFARLFGRGESRRARLEQAVQAGRERDDSVYEQNRADYGVYLGEHRKARTRAERVVSGAVDAWGEVVNEEGAFATIGMLGSQVAFSFVRENDAPPGAAHTRVGATVRVHGRSVVPDYALTWTATGRLSQRKLSKTDFHALHQDYVCGCALRVAREVLNILPATGVVVTCVDEDLDSATGYVGERVLLSVRVPRKTLDSVNLKACDASDAVTAMEHRMSYHKTQGLRPVEHISP